MNPASHSTGNISTGNAAGFPAHLTKDAIAAALYRWTTPGLVPGAMSVSELAARTGYDDDQIYDWRGGKHGMKAEALMRIGVALPGFITELFAQAGLSLVAVQPSACDMMTFAAEAAQVASNIMRAGGSPDRAETLRIAAQAKALSATAAGVGLMGAK